MVVGSPPAAHRPGLREFAAAWAGALAGASYVPLRRAEIEQRLEVLAGILVDAVLAEQFTPHPGYEVAAALIDADFAVPEVLGRSIEIIDVRLLADVGISGAVAERRLAALLGTLAIGFAWKLHDRTLDQQEAIRQAALVARDEVEQALRASEARFRHSATHDWLTGLPNRALMHTRLTTMLVDPAPDARIGVCFVDLDDFKAINDRLGHQVGDQLLIAVAGRLESAIAGTGGTLARLGGDEFIIVIEGTGGVADAVEMADRALAALAEPFQVGGHQLSVTASIGVVERPMAGTDATDLMRAADITMHWAKLEGKARWAVYDAGRDTRELARYALAAEMPAALRRGEFTLHYQPLVDLADGTIRGVEALARWRHPVLGLLAADQFVELAEATGLIIPLGTRLFAEACQQAVRWRELGPPVPFISVNMVASQLREPYAVPEILRMLDGTGLPPDGLQFELLERAVVSTDETMVAALRALARAGVRFAIDDFGTGYSSLAYLRTLPVHGVKFARAFVQAFRGGAYDPADESVLIALVELGRTLGLTTTAEGVETAAQAGKLQELGCDLAQGYYFAPPESAERIYDRIASRPAPRR